MTTNVQTYSTRSTAARGAIRAGHKLESVNIEQLENGRWYFVLIGETIDPAPVNNPPWTPEQQAQHAANVAEKPARKARKGKTAQVESEQDDGEADHHVSSEAQAAIAKVTYKQAAYYGESTVEKPVEFVHAFLSENPNLTRKQAVIALQGKGINYSTARTQYQKWFSARKATQFRARQTSK
jgi:hypothetical protein